MAEDTRFRNWRRYNGLHGKTADSHRRGQIKARRGAAKKAAAEKAERRLRRNIKERAR